MIAIILAHGNSSINFILYGLTNERFRQGYRYVLGLQKDAKQVKLHGKVSPRAQAKLPNAGAKQFDDVSDFSVKARAIFIQSSAGSGSEKKGTTIGSGTALKTTKMTSKLGEKKQESNAATNSSASDQLLSPNGIVIIAPDRP